MSKEKPPSAVKTVRELILWEYAKLIARGANLEGNYRFIMSRFQKLKCGEMQWSDITQDDRKTTSPRGGANDERT